MKTLWLGLLIATAIGPSCSQNNGTKADANAIVNNTGSTPLLDNSSGSSQAYWSTNPGASGVFTPDSLSVFNEYLSVTGRPLNNPSNFRVYIETTQKSSNRWGGEVRIGYYDNNQLYSSIFTSENPRGHATNRISYRNWYVGMPNSEFNQWFVYQGKTVFHGFFQDQAGVVVLVIDGGLDLGDGGGVTNISGSIWFKNFVTAPAPQYNVYNPTDYEQCWFLLAGPYQCGTFKDASGKVNTTSALYPSTADGFKRLGTFSGLESTRAFRQ